MLGLRQWLMDDHVQCFRLGGSHSGSQCPPNRYDLGGSGEFVGPNSLRREWLYGG